MSHPCNHYSCIENYHGECYGEGCKLNPMPEPSEPDTQDGDDENENTQEDGLTMADNETTADIIAWLRRPREGENAYLPPRRETATSMRTTKHCKCGRPKKRTNATDASTSGFMKSQRKEARSDLA